MKFPLIGSAVLLSLFLVFKFLPKDIVNLVLTGYFVLLGSMALTASIAPFFVGFFPERLKNKEYKVSFKIPFVSVSVQNLLCPYVLYVLCTQN